MKDEFKLGLLAMVVAVSGGALGSPARPGGEQRGFVVWDGGCIRSISKGLKTRMEAPLVDGEPDMSRAEIYGTVVDFDLKCGRIEIRRER